MKHLSCLFCLLGINAAAAAELQYNRDVRPILSDHCFRCHGPDAAARQADMRLDDAFNKNMPFDQFTIEQLAGDLLPHATVEQRIATGFNRNHMINNETGIIEEEFRVEYVADRVDTTATVWMGLTLGCARCHDHKYDPISQQDFYRFFSFFNNVPSE